MITFIKGVNQKRLWVMYLFPLKFARSVVRVNLNLKHKLKISKNTLVEGPKSQTVFVVTSYYLLACIYIYVYHTYHTVQSSIESKPDMKIMTASNFFHDEEVHLLYQPLLAYPAHGYKVGRTLFAVN